VDGKGQSSPISGLRVSSIDLKTDTTVRPAARGAVNSIYRCGP